uniref:PAM2 domain-containing protein n=1 Tax=Heligmosomoides polygyrus TaxID=6339 RepID=A0A183F535_HELPZ
LAMQLHAQLNPRSLRSRRDSEPSQVIQIHIQHTLQPSGSKPVPAKQHGKAKESQQGIGETKQNEIHIQNTQRPSGPKQTPTKQLGKTKEPQQQAGETSQNEIHIQDTQQPSGSDQLGKTKESQQQIVETNQNEDTQQPSGPKQTPAKQLGKAKESQQQLEETKQNEDTQQPSGSKQTPTKQLGKTKESQQEIEETKQNEDTQQPSGSKQTLAKQLGKTKESQQEIETKQNEMIQIHIQDTQQPSGSKQTPGKQLGKTKEPQQKAVETSQNEMHIQDTQQPSGANQLGKTKESQQQIVEGKLNEDTQRPSGPKQTPTKQLGKTKEPQQQAVEAKQNESESGMDLFNDILAGARNVTSKEKEDGGKKAAMTKRILPVKKECPGAKWQPEKVLEKEEVSKSVAPSSAVESVKLPVSNNDTPVEPTPVSGDTRAPSAAESSEALESTSLPTPRRTTRSCVAEHPRQSHVSSTPSRKPAAKPVEPVTPKEGAAETKSKSESAKKTTVTSSLPQKTPTAPKRESVLSPVRQTRARAEKAESTTDSTSSGPPSRVTSRTGPVAPVR